MKSDEKSLRNAGWISLGDKEEVEAWSHPSIYPYLQIYILSGIIILAGFFAPFVIEASGLVRWAGLLLIPIGAMMMLIEYLRYISVFYVFTSNRAIRKTGILSHSVKKVAYSQIDKTEKEFPLVGRILGFGSLIVITASPSDEDIRMDYLPQLKKAAGIIAEYRSEVSRARRDVDQEES